MTCIKYSSSSTIQTSGGIFTWSELITWPHIQWRVNEKKGFPLHLCNIPLYQYIWKTTSWEGKNLFAIFERFSKWLKFSIARFVLWYLALCNFKGYGNAARDADISFSSFFSPALFSPPLPSFLSRSRANSLRWWFPSFLRTRGRWRQPQHSRVSLCLPVSTTSPAAVSPQRCTLAHYSEMVTVYGLCDFFSPRRRRRDKVARSQAGFPTQGAGLFPKRRACPLQQHCSLLIGKKKQVQIHPSCLHSQSLSLYLLLSLSPFGSFSFCLVYFLMYKSSNASNRTFFFQSKKKNKR